MGVGSKATSTNSRRRDPRSVPLCALPRAGQPSPSVGAVADGPGAHSRPLTRPTRLRECDASKGISVVTADTPRKLPLHQRALFQVLLEWLNLITMFNAEA